MLSRISHFKVFFKDSNKKGWIKILTELIQFTWVKKEVPTDYFRKFLYRKNIHNITDYLSLKQYYSIVNSDKMVFPEVSAILSNKLSFAFLAERNQLPVPKLISYHIKNTFYFNNKSFIATDNETIIDFFNLVFNETKTNKLFLKYIKGQGGFGALIIEKSKLIDQIDLYHDILLKNSYIHQDIVEQHPEINKINSSSVNTLRIDVYLDEKNIAHVLSALMRFGIGNAITDNTHTGGFYVSVNLATGKLQGMGIQDIIEGGNTYTKHPNSHIMLEGFTVPFFNEACELARLASKYLPNKIIGWDIAITENGPIIIEGNYNPSLHVTDVAYGGYCKHPKIKEILEFIKK